MRVSGERTKRHVPEDSRHIFYEVCGNACAFVGCLFCTRLLHSLALALPVCHGCACLLRFAFIKGVCCFLSCRFCNPDVMEPWERRNHLDCMDSAPEKEFLVFGEFYSHEADQTGFTDMRWIGGDVLLTLFEKSMLRKAFAHFQQSCATACSDLLDGAD